MLRKSGKSLCVEAGKNYLESTGQAPTRLKVGVLWDDAVVKPHPPVTGALKEEKLKLIEETDILNTRNCGLYFATAEKKPVNHKHFREPWRPHPNVLPRKILTAGTSASRNCRHTMQREKYRIGLCSELERYSTRRVTTRRRPDTVSARPGSTAH